MYEPLIDKLRTRFDDLVDNRQWEKPSAILDSLAMVAVEACYAEAQGDIAKLGKVVHDLHLRIEVDHLPFRDTASPASVADQLKGISRVIGYADRNPAPPRPAAAPTAPINPHSPDNE
jgi:hypothetical protein